MGKPLPYITKDSLEYWEGCKQGKLLYQHCLNCEKNQFYPRYQCKYCNSKNLEYRESKGTGAIYTYTIVHRAPNPAYKEDIPYILAIVELDEGFRMMSNIVGVEEEINIGDRVRIEFEKRSEEIYIPQFRPMLTFEKLKIGKIYGQSTFECTLEKVKQWNEIYFPESKEEKFTFLSPGMSGIIVMNTYDSALKGRPPGNVHGSQKFHFYRPITIGETLTTTLSIQDKFIKKNRKWVVIKTKTYSKNQTLLLEGTMNILWAE